MTLSTSRTTARRIHRLVSVVPPALLGLAMAVTIAGCPAGAELEDPGRFAVGTGGTGPSTGGTGPTAGSSGSGTTGGTGPTLACDGVDAVTVLNTHCARSGCHNARSHVGGLDMTPDANLATRLRNVVATHSEIDCGNGVFMECIPDTCPAPGTAMLVDADNPDDSWILKKINGTHTDCGLPMPVAPGDTGFDAMRKACIEKIVRDIAAP